MAIENADCVAAENEETRPTFEEMLKDAALSGDLLKNVLDFAEFLKANEMVARGGEVTYKDKCVCYTHLDGVDQKPGPWTIWTEGSYCCEREDVPMNGRMKKIAWAHVNFCGDCGGGCSPGARKVIFGKEFDNVCGAEMAFCAPDAEAMECVKKLLEMKKLSINEEGVK